MITRDQWGAASPTRPWVRRDPAVIVAAVLHWSAGAPANNHLFCDDQVRGIQRFHQRERGWRDIAYHRLICAHGYVFEGLPLDVIGAHTENNNTRTVGYCLLTDRTPTPGMLGALCRALTDDQRSLRRNYPDVHPHSFYKQTACPGDAARGWLAVGSHLRCVPHDDEPEEDDMQGSFVIERENSAGNLAGTVLVHGSHLIGLSGNENKDAYLKSLGQTQVGRLNLAGYNDLRTSLGYPPVQD